MIKRYAQPRPEVVLLALRQDLQTNISFDKCGQGFSIISVNQKYQDEFYHKWVDMIIIFIFAILATNSPVGQKVGNPLGVSGEKREPLYLTDQPVSKN
jgi:hypothetical protein